MARSTDNKNFINVSINSFDYFYNDVVTIYQALLQKGWYIPRFCYHVKLALAGNCRMCFVEVTNIHKPIIACATMISKGMQLFTNSLLAFKAREGILEFILINHPIDCPVCDQGGECDLQDQYIVMGSLISRFYDFSKKSIKNKNISFLIKLSLNKCINCSRCTRYSQNITGEYSFSLLGRGENSVISNYTNNIFVGEITGNVMDLCPVGASTSKIISYDFRIWELIDVKFLDFLDIMHPPIRIDFRGLKLLRILPLSNSVIQEEWISDKLRYNSKSLFKNRFFLPYIKKGINFISFSWNSVLLILKNLFLKIINFFVKKKSFFLVNNKLCEFTTDIFNSFFFKKYFKKVSFFNQNLKKKSINFLTRNSFMLQNKNLDFLEIEKILFLNINLRYELPLLNYKIREKVTFDFIEIFLCGPILDLNYFFIHIGNSIKVVFNFVKSFKEKVKMLIFYANIANNVCLFLKNFLKEKKNVICSVENTNNLELLNSEFNFTKNFIYNKFKNNYSINFIINNYSNNLNNNFVNKKLNILLSQNIFNIKFFNFILPKKFNFEQNSMFLNIFGVYNDFTFIVYKSNYKTLKNDWNILEDFFIKLKSKFKLPLSFIREKFIPKAWIFNEYSLNIYKFNFLNKNNKFNIKKQNYVYIKNSNFYNDIFSKNNTLANYFNTFKKFNIFSFYNNINSIHWIF